MIKETPVLHSAATVTTGTALAIILLWFGVFKFTPTEAKAIEGLVKNSFLMSWMYKAFSMQMVSQIIGVTEIIAALGIIAGFFYPKIGIAGSSLSALIFFVTCTFMITTPGSFEKIDGVWVPSDVGSFLIKDLVAFGASLILLANWLKP